MIHPVENKLGFSPPTCEIVPWGPIRRQGGAGNQARATVGHLLTRWRAAQDARHFSGNIPPTNGTSFQSPEILRGWRCTEGSSSSIPTPG